MTESIKEDLQIISLLIDIIKPFLIQEYVDKYPHVTMIITDSELRKRSCVKNIFVIQDAIYEEFGLYYPLEHIRIAVNNQKKYKNGSSISNRRFAKKRINS